MKLSASFLREALGVSASYAYENSLFYSLDEFVARYSFVLLEDNAHHRSVCIDSRKLQPGEIFCPLIGARVDSHDFIADVLGKGAYGVLLNASRCEMISSLSSELVHKKFFIAVPDTMQALVALAKTWRSYFSYPIVGVSGSLGKTTTKEMLRSILQVAGMRAYVSFKNQNTIIGLPLNVLNLTEDYQVAIFEMGINAPGEMKELVDILRPTLALLTSISHAHTEELRSLSLIAQEKRHIFDYLQSTHIGIIPGDQPLLSNASYHHLVIRFGRKIKNQIQARSIKYVTGSDEMFPSFLTSKISFILKIYDKKFKVLLPTDSPAMVVNALAAAALAHALGISGPTIVQGLGAFKPVDGRFKKEYSAVHKALIINDCYNASPESMKNALVSFDKMTASGMKIAVLGEMLELGDKEHYWHRKMGRELCKLKVLDYVLLVGERTKSIAKTAPLTVKIEWVLTWQEAYERLNVIVTKNSLVLLKGSDGVGLRNIVQRLRDLEGVST